ncbi:MAG TPA: hypothetical protein VKV17_00040, partial [Bryobacteraceae bacterium]|nr:hypothetical protein [Bryobacteraceae bacterium]
MAGGLLLESLVSLVIPDYYHIFEPDTGYRLPYNYTFLYAYCGAATPLLLAIAALWGKARERLFLAVAIVCVFWMLGEHTPVYHSIFRRLPVFLRGILYAEYALIAFCFFAGLTAAQALDRFGKRIPEAALFALFTSYELIHTGDNRAMNSGEGSYKQENPGNQIGYRTEMLDYLRLMVNQALPPTRVDYPDDGMAPAVTASEMFGLPTMDGDNPFLLRRVQFTAAVVQLGRIVATEAAGEPAWLAATRYDQRGLADFGVAAARSRDAHGGAGIAKAVRRRLYSIPQ